MVGEGLRGPFSAAVLGQVQSATGQPARRSALPGHRPPYASHSLTMPLAPSTRLGPYEILAPLGAGGMGEVYRARDSRLDRDVAIKILPERLARDPQALARFEREAKAVAALSHPNIMAIHD